MKNFLEELEKIFVAIAFAEHDMLRNTGTSCMEVSTVCHTAQDL